ncbi:3-hydroxyisobutyrate dehydrogenase [Paracoccidioides lutzii Pb01]|uniref:3-hydroxyisobutyrate dehydrogenase n=1 Tax=Paracoccidioides lutzii (strain ATCC MYA-826 / Pb01) TaxID=502779 RepID=C1GZN4_PARBA|nr:3-hydroxyisobutyrate dehydrogenase [Paracoccidioides lutzii Pb01]EEH42057.1 3-hydroxyisobutyrate dehydrogenase [Paracoccidioides lutzii Pb01]
MSTSVLKTPLRRVLASARTLHAAQRAFSTSRPRNATWGFIGLGQMGFPMARNLRSKIPESDTLIICDSNPKVTQQFVQEVASGLKVEVAASPQQLARESETIITSLPEPRHVKDVFHHILKCGLPKLPQDKERLFVDCSTIDPASSREVANAVHSTGAGKFVDAPMSGGVVGASAGTLTFMLGASSKVPGLAQRAENTLLFMGKKVWHLGEQGAGLSGKLANNYLLAIQNIATAEAMNLGIRWGLDAKTLGQMINSSTGRSWSSEVNNPVPGVVETAPASREYKGGFGIGLMKKDLRLAVEAAREAGTPLMLAEKAQEVYEETDGAHAGKDFSVVYKYLQEKSR